MSTDYTTFNVAICEWLGLDPTNVAGFMINANGDETTIMAELITAPNAPDHPDDIGSELRRFRVCPFEDGQLTDHELGIIERLDACEDRLDVGWILAEAVTPEVADAFRRAMERIP